MTRSSRRNAVRRRAALLLVAMAVASTAGASHVELLPRLHDSSHELTGQGHTTTSKQPCVACALTHTPALPDAAPACVAGVAPDAGLLPAEQTHAPAATARSSHGSRAPPSCR